MQKTPDQNMHKQNWWQTKLLSITPGQEAPGLFWTSPKTLPCSALCRIYTQDVWHKAQRHVVALCFGGSWPTRNQLWGNTWAMAYLRLDSSLCIGASITSVTLQYNEPFPHWGIPYLMWHVWLCISTRQLYKKLCEGRLNHRAVGLHNKVPYYVMLDNLLRHNG